MVGRPTWAEISLPRLRENFQAIRELIGPGIQILAVIKANAYGHGAPEVARALAAEGAAWFGVTSTPEGIALRSAGITRPVLLLGGFWPGEEAELAEYRLTPTVFSAEQLALLEAHGRRHGVRMPFHLKVDTGMRRLGISTGDLAPFLARLRASAHTELEGFCTHLAAADHSAEQTREQLALFNDALCAVRREGFDPPLVHIANSAALARWPESRATMVRPGLALYGYQLCETPLRVAPVLSLKSRAVALRQVPRGAAVGYGGSYVAQAPSVIATVSAGYADGVSHALSNRGRALVRGCFAPMVGRVTMDFTLLDVTAVDGVQAGDEVVFIGRQGAAEITAAEAAEQAGAIPHEILSRIGARVPRVYLES